MTMRDNESHEHDFWKDVHSLWIRYCGVSDEIKTLRNRWIFLADLPYLPLPRIKDGLFSRLLNLESTLETRFQRLGFSRYDLETKGLFEGSVSLWTDTELELFISSIRDVFGELEEYLGILKHAFFQRTSSLEIPYSVGLSRSPQKTMGDELIHLAADRVAKSYLSCLAWGPDLTWDEVVSFLYPQRESFAGGEFRCMPHTKMFHLSLSEDGKYFPGAFLLLAHEACHSAMFKVAPSGIVRQCGWASQLWTDYSDLCRDSEPLRDSILGYSSCADCEYLSFIECVHSQEQNIHYFQQCVADVLALEIGGICTLLSLVDLAPYPETLFRVAFVLGYCEVDKTYIDEIRAEEKSLYAMLARKKGETCNRGNPELCLNYLSQFGKKAGLAFGQRNKSIISDNLPSYSAKSASPPFVEFDKVCPHLFDLQCLQNPCCQSRPSITSHLVRKFFKYSFDGDLGQQLSSGLCAPEGTDPRLILHVFYKLYRWGRTPSYSATLHSLAFSGAT